MTMLTIAAQKHHSDTKPLTVSHMSTGTATRFNAPRVARSR